MTCGLMQFTSNFIKTPTLSIILLFFPISSPLVSTVLFLLGSPAIWLTEFRLLSNNCCIVTNIVTITIFLKRLLCSQTFHRFLTWVLYFYLFILYTNDVSEIFLNCTFLLFENDLKIYRSATIVSDALLLQEELNSLSSWCSRNEISFNLTKVSCNPFQPQA